MATKGKKSGLGRGLDALFADREVAVNEDIKLPAQEESGDSVKYISINDIKPNHGQPRKTFDPEKISELARSIEEHGIIQPLVVTKAEVGYEIVAGERRWRAAREADLKKVPCLVRTLTDEENMLLAIIENMQREDLNPIEEAEGLEKMIKVYGFTQDKVSKSVSKSRPYITNALRLLNLPESVRKEVAEGRLSAGHARAILSADNFQKQEELCKRVIAEGLSVRETEKLASTEKQKRNKALKRVKPKEILSMENELKDIYGTKVNIEAKGKGGSIQLHYYSMDELNRLIDILRVANINS